MGGEDGGAAAADAEFGVDGSDVALDGVDRDGEVGGDFDEREHGGEEFEDGEFAFAEGGVSVFGGGAGGECLSGEGLGGSEAAELVNEEFADSGAGVGEGSQRVERLGEGECGVQGAAGGGPLVGGDGEGGFQ